MPLADHSTSKPRSASSAVISSAVSLSSSISSTFVINRFPTAAGSFAGLEASASTTARLPESRHVNVLQLPRVSNEASRTAPPALLGQMSRRAPPTLLATGSAASAVGTPTGKIGFLDELHH